MCRVERSGVSAQAGAVRYALSKALTAFVDDAMVERMRIGEPVFEPLQPVFLVFFSHYFYSRFQLMFSSVFLVVSAMFLVI